jgi:beta-glucosidase
LNPKYLFILIIMILLAVFSLTNIEYVQSGSGAHNLSNRMFLDEYMIPWFVSKSIPKNIPDVIRRGIMLSYIVATEGIVLLKNNGVLPLNGSEKIAVFGQAQNRTWYYHVGGSSYVEISEERRISLIKGLLNAGLNIDMDVLQRYMVSEYELPFTDEELEGVAARNDIAIIVISRYSTEGSDLQPESFNLTREEQTLIKKVTTYFNKIILILNTPNAINIEPWINDEKISAILWVGYPGEQGGNAVTAILLGLVNPSGKLPFTWAKRYCDYPSARYFGKFYKSIYYEDIYVGYRYFDTFNVEPAYPFGYGLSYTNFSISVVNASINEDKLRIIVNVTNIGKYPGKEVIQVYMSYPEDRLEQPYQKLIMYSKTKLLEPGESELLSLEIKVENLASYDEELSAWILEKGDYIIRVGDSSRNTHIAVKLYLPETVIVEGTLNRMHAPVFERLSKKEYNITPIHYPTEQEELINAPQLILDPRSIKTINKTSTPPFVPPPFEKINASKTITLKEVVNGDYTIKQMIAQMNIDELANLIIGLHGMDKYGIPELRVADGPNGLRNGPSPNPGGTAFPSATILAATWNLDLAEKVGRQIGEEMIWANITLWLAPGLNILRNPLMGRSGEYFSEDPILSGTMGAAVVKGVQSNHGVGAVPKHLVGNEQEFNRFRINSIISERALREIYLKPFEITVKTADPWAIMTSYNKINGVYPGNDFNLCTAILRGEWGFKGFVMTDWGSGSYNKYAIPAGNDVLMPWIPDYSPQVIESIKKAINTGEITLGQLQRNVYNILRVTIRSRALAQNLEIPQEKLYRYNPPPGYFMVYRLEKVKTITKTNIIKSIEYYTVTHSIEHTETVTYTTKEYSTKIAAEPLNQYLLITTIMLIIIITILLYLLLISKRLPGSR